MGHPAGNDPNERVPEDSKLNRQKTTEQTDSQRVQWDQLMLGGLQANPFGLLISRALSAWEQDSDPAALMQRRSR